MYSPLFSPQGLVDHGEQFYDLDVWSKCPTYTQQSYHCSQSTNEPYASMYG
jgi:hypothetical protein